MWAFILCYIAGLISLPVMLLLVMALEEVKFDLHNLWRQGRY